MRLDRNRAKSEAGQQSTQGLRKILEHILRLAGDNEKLSTNMQSLADLMRESTHAEPAVDNL